MKRRKTHPREFMDVLIERGRAIPTAPESVRARTLARARSSMGAVAKEEPARAPVAGQRRLAMAVAASVAFAVGAAVAAVALRGGKPQEPPAEPPPLVEPAPRATPTRLPPSSPGVNTEPGEAPKPERTKSSVSARESYTAELGILQHAQVAYATRDFATTLRLVADHGRRFPNGRLAEEREALRAKALIGAGREEEANQAASSFEARYPRSPLLR